MAKSKVDDDGYVVQPQDIKLDELAIDSLRDYAGEKRAGMLKAIAKELQDLASLGTFKWCRLPDDRRAMSSKLVLKIKYKADGSFQKFKGRLVARGFEARPGVDFFGTFAPMASMTTVRTVFALAVHHSTDIIHSDIPNAFLQSQIDIPQYIMFPKGITIDPKCIYNQVNKHNWDNRVVKLLRSIYGLKSAPQLFNKMLTQFLEGDLKLKRGTTDTCLYHFNNNDGWVLLATEVDDLVISGTNLKKIDEIKGYLQRRFKMTDWDNPINSFLGLRLAYDKEAGRLEMDVEEKVLNLFKRHSVLNSCRPRKTPLPPKEISEAEPNHTPTKLQEYIAANYASIVGALIYMSITCRPDIAFAIGRTSRGMHSPTLKHVKMLEHLCGYMINFPHVKLVYKRSGNAIESHLSHLSESDSALSSICCYDYKGEHKDDKGPDPLFGMTDSDYANTKEDSRRSISGYCFFVYGCLVSWRSKLQPLTAASTHEAELIAMSFAADEAVWTRRLLMEVGFAVPSVYHVRAEELQEDPTEYEDRKTERWIARLRPTWLLGDNQATIFTANNPETSQRSKHLEIRWFRVRDYVKDLTLRVRHIPTGGNVADFFTKSLQGPDSFERFRKHLMGDQDFKPRQRR